MVNPVPQRQVYLSGKMVPESEAKISIFDSAVMLGDSLTESTRTFQHRPFRLDEHISRLYRSLKVSRVDPGLSPSELTRITLEVLDANRSLMDPDDDCWIVHNISRGLMKPGPSTSRHSSAMYWARASSDPARYCGRSNSHHRGP